MKSIEDSNIKEMNTLLLKKDESIEKLRNELNNTKKILDSYKNENEKLKDNLNNTHNELVNIKNSTKNKSFVSNIDELGITNTFTNNFEDLKNIKNDISLLKDKLEQLDHKKINNIDDYDNDIKLIKEYK